MAALVRSASLTRFVELAAQCGVDGRALARQAGLPPGCLDDPDLKVPARQVGRLLELAAAAAGEPAFGMRLAESRRLSNLGPLALLVRDEPTLRSALEALMRHIHLHNEAVAVRVEQVDGLVVIRIDLDAEGAPSVRQATELVVGATFRVLQVLMGAEWRPRAVCFRHGAPASRAVHARVLGSRVEFGHEFDGIVCTAADLDAPNPGADPVMAACAQRLLAAGGATPSSLGDRVRQLLVMLLPRGMCRVEVVARHLGVDRRTVARRLAAEGTTFVALVDELRCDLFARYRADGGRRLAEVAALLGFSAPSALSRWHRQRFGTTARGSGRRVPRPSDAAGAGPGTAAARPPP